MLYLPMLCLDVIVYNICVVAERHLLKLGQHKIIESKYFYTFTFITTRGRPKQYNSPGAG